MMEKFFSIHDFKYINICVRACVRACMRVCVFKVILDSSSFKSILIILKIVTVFSHKNTYFIGLMGGLGLTLND